MTFFDVDLCDINNESMSSLSSNKTHSAQETDVRQSHFLLLIANIFFLSH